MSMLTDRHASPLGRRAVVDPRDLWYLLADRVPERSGPPPSAHGRVYRGPTYDQGGEPLGVACALLAALHASPDRIGPPRCPSVRELDRRIRALEGAVGPSVTVRSGCRALQALGLITGYAWSYDEGEVRDWLLSGRGLVLGLDWYEAMGRPDGSGLIRSWGRPAGGHAVFAFGYEPAADAVLIQNSRGEGWGGWVTRPGRRDFRGCARLPLHDLQKLLADNGEAVALFKNPAWDRSMLSLTSDAAEATA